MPTLESIRPSKKARTNSDFVSHSRQSSSTNTSDRESFDSTLSLPCDLDGKSIIENDDVNEGDAAAEEYIEEQNSGAKDDRLGLWKKTWKNCKRPG